MTRWVRTFLGVLLFSALTLSPCLTARSASEASPIDRFRVYYPLYLVGGSYLYPVEHYVPKTENPALEAMRALFAGLSEDAGFRFVKFPADTQVLGLGVQDGVCTLDCSQEILGLNVGSGGEYAVIQAIVYTLTQFSGIDKVEILIEGEVAETLAGHVDIGAPLSRSYRIDPIFRGFDDAYQHWSGGSIMVLQLMDVLAGFPDGTVRPDGQLLRGEFVKMLVEALSLDDAPDVEIPYSDMKGHWAEYYVKKALGAGAIDPEDYGDLFFPDEAIFREEVAHLLVPAMEAYAQEHPEIVYPEAIQVAPFLDTADIRCEYAESVLNCASLGLVVGYTDGTFRPKSALTRGEGATVIARLLGVSGAGGWNVVASPKPGYEPEGDRIAVLGAAAAFEGTVNFRFLGPLREMLYENYTTSTLGMGWGAVGVSVQRSLLSNEPNSLEVFMVSALDGSDWRVVPVPFR